MLSFRDGSEFTTGVCSYRFRPAAEGDRTSRIMIPIRLGGISLEAVLDTGALYLICPIVFAAEIGLDRASGTGTDTISIRGIYIEGTLHKIALQLIAEEGDNLSFDVTVFVPTEDIYRELPVFLGVQNCLELIRFAIEPAMGGDDFDIGEFHFGFP